MDIGSQKRLFQKWLLGRGEKAVRSCRSGCRFTVSLLAFVRPYWLANEVRPMPKKKPVIRAFEAKRIRYDSTRSFDDVLSDLRKLVGNATHYLQESANTANPAKPAPDTKAPGTKAPGTKASGTKEDFEKHIKSLVGESDFMLFVEVNHSDWLPYYGIRRKVMRWIFGNPVIASTMLRHDLTAGLFAPVEILLIENDTGGGCTIVYDLPSSLMVLDDNPPLLQAAKDLDAKLAALIEHVT